MDVGLLLASSDRSGMQLSNVSDCVPKERKLFAPIGSYGVHAFAVYMIPIICILGIIGNVITFIIINESSNRIVGHFFIKMLTIFDSLSLIFLLPPIWADLTVRPFYHFKNKYGVTWADKLSTAWGVKQAQLILTFFTRTVSIYIIVLFTVERCLKVKKPFLAQTLCTVKNAKWSMLILIAASLLLSIIYGFAFDKITIKSPCHAPVVVPKTNSIFFVARTFYMILLSVIPSFLIISCNFLIIHGMRKSAGSRYRQNLTQTDDERNERNKVESDETKQQREITNRLLLVSFTFFLLNFPLFVITSIHTNSQLTKQRYHLSGGWADAFHIALILFILNLAINFILYCFTGTLFRKAAFNLLLCRIDRMKRYRSGLSGAPTSRTAIVNRDSAGVLRGDSGRNLLRKNEEKASETGV